MSKLWFVLSSSFILRVLPTYHPVLFSRLIRIYCLFPHLYLQLDLDVCTTYLIIISKFTFHSAYFSVYLHILDFSNIPHLNLRCFFLPSDLGHIISRVILDSSLSLTIHSHHWTLSLLYASISWFLALSTICIPPWNHI